MSQNEAWAVPFGRFFVLGTAAMILVYALVSQKPRQLLLYACSLLTSTSVYFDRDSPFGSGTELWIGPEGKASLLLRWMIAGREFSYVRIESRQCNEILNIVSSSRSINCLYVENCNTSEEVLAKDSLNCLSIQSELCVVNADITHALDSTWLVRLKHVSFVDCTLSQELQIFAMSLENAKKLELNDCRLEKYQSPSESTVEDGP